MKPIWPWLFPLLVLGLAIYIAIRNYPWWQDEFEKWFISVTVTFFVLFAMFGACGLGVGVSSVIGKMAEWKWEKNWTQEMVSMRNADGIHGEVAGGVFMISGFVDSVQVYHYYTRNENGSFAPHSWRANGYTSVFEGEKFDGRVQQWVQVFVHPRMEWFGYPEGDVAMQFFIPKGSLQQKFELK